MGLHPGLANRQDRIRLRKKKLPRRKRFWGSVLAILFLLVLGLAYHQVQSWIVKPDAVFVLGGSPDREAFAAEFAQQHPDLPIWVSSGSPEDYARSVFADWGIAPERLHLDYRAVDTVTNFTSLVEDFKYHDYRSVYLVTSDYHMRRARTIGLIVLGSQGIEFQPLSVPSGRSPESWSKVVRDGARSLLWVATGRTGASLGVRYRSQLNATPEATSVRP